MVEDKGVQVIVTMPGESYSGDSPPLSPTEQMLRRELQVDVDYLAITVGERNLWRFSGLQRAADFIADRFESAGLAVRSIEVPVEGKSCRNLEVEIPGGGRRNEIVVVGAHYDTVADSPGANDNGSGIAAMLALARRFAGRTSARTLRFVAFVNEEPPYFQSDSMGSLVYARNCRRNDDTIVAMMSLETIGYFTDEPGSQKYPFPMQLFYPSTGNFIGFVGNYASEKLVRESVRIFRERVPFPAEGAAMPAWIPGIGWSDQWSFWQCGYPALMVTDTAPFRYPFYHTPDDLPDKMNFDGFARVVAGLNQVVAYLANDYGR